MNTYAQDKEDIIIAGILPMDEIGQGKYIDVGASDPEIISVTKAFYDMGWSGINIEPLPDAYERLCEERTRDININAGLASKSGKATLHINASGSSFDEETIRALHFENSDTVEVEMYTLYEICRKYAAEWPDIHFCKIDVEGYEREVLLGMTEWETFRPWLFIMESTYAGTEIPCYEKWEDILLDNGYMLKTAHGINRYYVDSKRHAELLDREIVI